ncbi:NAD(P)H-dependent oxidoreductase [Rhodococcus koreensis]|uniref:NAD(P)H dehydrogenase (Quinone) n=1 Tax=Rhodococcus koreensis TaxID=99653 RepID=A0A1H4TIV1_9NOCA|nr:NAD(P)H-dependent oxidoreductase [Rhodococcus koreensis]SEC56317.1 NAD(P)H dehydrogenase (quinone) [Rhodococcus koreensis]
MNILVVFAHPERRSFCGALKDTAVRTLTDLGHEVTVSDLYAMKWIAELDSQDFTGERVDADYLDLSREQEHAFATRTQAFDIEQEQRKVAQADLILFHFPVWWFSMPAILKGWVDRVFARGFAYSAGRKYGKGHFFGKKAMICLTTGTDSTLYEPNGIDGDLLHVLWPIHNGILAYTGFTVLPPFAAWMPGRVSADERQGYLDGFARHLTAIEEAEPLFFHPWEDYDETQRLKPGIKARSGIQWNPRAGQTFEQAAHEYDQRMATER